MSFAEFTVPEFISALIDRAAAREGLNHRSHRGDGQLDGLLGEWAFDRWCSDSWIDCDYVDNANHDFVVFSRNKKKPFRVDAKTKRRTVIARDNYTVHVETAQREYACDVYAFFNAVPEQQLVQFVGWQWKHRFWECCSIVNAGDKNGNHTETMNAGVLAISALRPPFSLQLGLIRA